MRLMWLENGKKMLLNYLVVVLVAAQTPVLLAAREKRQENGENK